MVYCMEDRLETTLGEFITGLFERSNCLAFLPALNCHHMDAINVDIVDDEEKFVTAHGCGWKSPSLVGADDTLQF